MHEGCDRAGYYEQADFAKDYNSPKCQVKIGCWGPVINCNVPKRGWMNGVGGCPYVGGICIGCTMPGFPDKFMPFMDMPPGGSLSSMLGKPYEMSAETLMPSQVDFIRKDDFLRFLQKYPQASMNLAVQLSDNCAAAHNDIRSLGLAQNTGDKLARLLVDWSERTGTRVATGLRMTVLLKHEEIAQMIGATRETVTRTLSDFRRQKLLEVRGSTFIVADGLQRLATI